MEKVSICHGCGRTIESAFAYCPWCGCAASTDGMLSHQVDLVCERVELKQKEYTSSRIQRMENELGELENELSLLLSVSQSR